MPPSMCTGGMIVPTKKHISDKLIHTHRAITMNLK